MTMYQLQNQGLVCRLSDGAVIPADEANSDYRDYLLWVAAGNNPEPITSPPPPAAPTPDFVGFLDAMIASAFYQKVLQQASASPPINVAFTAATGALVLAAAGRPNLGGVQSGITALLSLMTLVPGDIEEVQEMLDASYLGELISLPEV